MAGKLKERSLEVTPTWAIALVCFVLLAISILIEHFIHIVAHWLKKKHKNALYEAVEKIKAELMLMGFISLLLTVGQGPISSICVPRNVAHSWHPCDKTTLDSEYDDPCLDKGKVTLVSRYGIHQLHIFIFVLAVFHVLYCITTLVLGRLKMRKWRSWEDETRTLEYQYSHDPARFRLARETTFGRRHLSFWSNSPALLWIGCFFRQFYTSVAKVDYLTLRNGFINAHLGPQSQTSFDFHKYISKSLEEDFKVVVGISPVVWLFAVLLLLTNTHGWYSYYWLPFIPLIIILAIGTKLQMIITKMGVKTYETADVVKGAPVVQPSDELFWFGSPRLVLLLINFVLFQNAFQLAFFIWSWYEFGLRSCYHQRREDIIIRISMGVLIQVVCSYVTLPLYALVTQMGSSMRPTIFSEQIATAIKSWRQTAEKQVKQSHHSGHSLAFSSRSSGTPSHSQGTSPMHLLHGQRLSHFDSSPRASSFGSEHWAGIEYPQIQDDDNSSRDGQKDGGKSQQPSSTQTLRPPILVQHDVHVLDFSFSGQL